MRLGAFITLAIIFAIGLEFHLIVFDRRVLLHQRTVYPGEHYEAGAWGDLGRSEQASMACTYFTGRGLALNVFWYSPDNILGRDQCPFLLGP